MVFCRWIHCWGEYRTTGTRQASRRDRDNVAKYRKTQQWHQNLKAALADPGFICWWADCWGTEGFTGSLHGWNGQLPRVWPQQICESAPGLLPTALLPAVSDINAVAQQRTCLIDSHIIWHCVNSRGYCRDERDVKTTMKGIGDEMIVVYFKFSWIHALFNNAVSCWKIV
jgi:hypothetical protein